MGPCQHWAGATARARLLAPLVGRCEVLVTIAVPRQPLAVNPRALAALLWAIHEEGGHYNSGRGGREGSVQAPPTALLEKHADLFRAAAAFLARHAVELQPAALLQVLQVRGSRLGLGLVCGIEVAGLGFRAATERQERAEQPGAAVCIGGKCTGEEWVPGWIAQCMADREE